MRRPFAHNLSLLPPFIDGRRDRRMGELIGILWVLALADLAFTLWANRFTRFEELNPIAAAMLANGLTVSLVLFKLVLTTIAATIFWRLRAHTRAEVGLWAIVLVYVALAFRWHDYTLGTTAVAAAL
jgi:DMSO/TMAO reductase YedYZ heme-binding membrane subunit